MQVDIDPSSAVYRAEKVDVKTGEEEEETMFSLEKAKLFEYVKSDGASGGDGAGGSGGGGSWSVKGVGCLRLNRHVGAGARGLGSARRGEEGGEPGDGKREGVDAGAGGAVGEGGGAEGEVGSVRVVMRKIGNLELILNSRLFAGMACKKGYGALS